MIVDFRFEGGMALPSTSLRASVAAAFEVGCFEDAKICNPKKTSI
jgi:hypothetical protein